MSWPQVRLLMRTNLGSVGQQAGYLILEFVRVLTIANSPGAPSHLLQAGAILNLTLTLKVEEGLSRDGAEESFLSFWNFHEIFFPRLFCFRSLRTNKATSRLTYERRQFAETWKPFLPMAPSKAKQSPCKKRESGGSYKRPYIVWTDAIGLFSQFTHLTSIYGNDFLFP